MGLSMRQKLTRMKRIEPGQESQLDRCMSTFDLTALGIGSTLGLGIYVLTGEVAGKTAGPSVVLSFLLAAIASVFAGLCYAEFGARVPKAGSAYVYSYVTIGEFVAFIIGWNLILEYVIGTSSVAKGYSLYLDVLLNNTVQTHLEEWFPLPLGEHFSSYPDLLSLGITLLLTGMLSIGVKESTRFNSIFTCFNILIVLYVIVTGLFKVDLRNWTLPASEVPAGKGVGGFFPFGVAGMLSGAATCFYGFVGFDCIATSGEEVKNPSRAIPIAIVGSLTCVFLAYFGVSTIETLIWPYYDTDSNAPLPYVFEKVGYPFAKWVITVGGLAGLSTSLLGAMFPLPRVLYSMASDGLIFRSLCRVNKKTKIPLLATVASGVFAGLMSALFNLKELADMMSIGTLLAYTLVAVSVVILRYTQEPEPEMPAAALSENSLNNLVDSGSQFCLQDVFKPVNLFNLSRNSLPTQLSTYVSNKLILIACLTIVVLDAVVFFLLDSLVAGGLLAIATVSVVFLAVAFFCVCLCLQPINAPKPSFEVPWVPLLPLLSVMINVFLMLNLSSPTWVRFGVWMLIGFSIYFLYGIEHSTGAMGEEEKQRFLISRGWISFYRPNPQISYKMQSLKFWNLQ